VGELKARIADARREANQLRRSLNYRVGTLVLKPLRLVARIVRRLAGSR